MFGFDVAALVSDLAGSVIRDVRLRVLNVSATASTVDLVFGTHMQLGIAAEFSEVRTQVLSDVWPASGYGGNADGWHTMDPYVGRAFRDGLALGLTVHQPDSLASAGQLDPASVVLAVDFTAPVLS